MPENEIVVYERGREVTKAPKRLPPELLQIIMLDDIQVALSKLNQHHKKREFQGGLIDERTLEVTDRVQSMTFIGDWPRAPLINAFFINDGTKRAYIGINHTGEYFTMEPGETKTVDRVGAEERISGIFYWSDKGEETSVRVNGEY
ncbi:hypothetical protein ES703_06386 [subsurface metagenome]